MLTVGAFRKKVLVSVLAELTLCTRYDEQGSKYTHTHVHTHTGPQTNVDESASYC